MTRIPLSEEYYDVENTPHRLTGRFSEYGDRPELDFSDITAPADDGPQFTETYYHQLAMNVSPPGSDTSIIVALTRDTGLWCGSGRAGNINHGAESTLIGGHTKAELSAAADAWIAEHPERTASIPNVLPPMTTYKPARHPLAGIRFQNGDFNAPVK